MPIIIYWLVYAYRVCLSMSKCRMDRIFLKASFPNIPDHFTIIIYPFYNPNMPFVIIKNFSCSQPTIVETLACAALRSD